MGRLVKRNNETKRKKEEKETEENLTSWLLLRVVAKRGNVLLQLLAGVEDSGACMCVIQWQRRVSGIIEYLRGQECSN